MKRTLGTRLSDATYRATRPLRTVKGNVGNWQRRRFLQTGKGFAVRYAARRLGSRIPVYRNRINPGTGRPRRDDAIFYRSRAAERAAALAARARVAGDLARIFEHADRSAAAGASRPSRIHPPTDLPQMTAEPGINAHRWQPSPYRPPSGPRRSR